MSNRKATYTLQLNSNVIAVLQQHEAAAKRLDTTMWQVQKTMSSFGVGLGAHFLINGAQAWLGAAADYETAMLRVKNASDKVRIGIGNQFFIGKEVDNFKLKLQESVDAYGSFLFKIKNAGLSNSETNRMYDNILTISKVASLPQGEIDATVRNIGIMLGEGVLEARHLRGLSYVHPQIVPFLAQALGLKDNKKDVFASILKEDTDDFTASQKLSKLISSGKLTKMALPATVILQALEEYRKSVQDKLGETLNTLQSNMNTVGTDFLRFKDIIAQDLKPELNDLFESLKDGIHWLTEHKDLIEYLIVKLPQFVKIWLEYKLVMGGINMLNATYMGFVSGMTGALVKEQTATASLNRQILLLNENLQILINLQGMAAIGAGNLTRAQVALATANPVLAGSTAATAAATRSSMGLGLGAMFIRGMTAVAVGYFAADALSQLGVNKSDNGFKFTNWDYFKAITDRDDFFKTASLAWIQDLVNESGKPYGKSDSTGLATMINNAFSRNGADPNNRFTNYFTGLTPIDKYGQHTQDDSTLVQILSQKGIRFFANEKAERDKYIAENFDKKEMFQGGAYLGAYRFYAKSLDDNGGFKKPYDSNKIGLGKDNELSHIRGNTITNINIEINGGLNGMVNPKFEVKNMSDMSGIEDAVGEIIVKKLTDAINDSQLVGGHH